MEARHHSNPLHDLHVYTVSETELSGLCIIDDWIRLMSRS